MPKNSKKISNVIIYLIILFILVLLVYLIYIIEIKPTRIREQCNNQYQVELSNAKKDMERQDKVIESYNIPTWAEIGQKEESNERKKYEYLVSDAGKEATRNKCLEENGAR